MPRYKKEWWEKAKQFQAPLIELADLMRMLEKARDKQERVALILLYYTGARPSEIVNLKKEHVKKFRNQIAINFITLKKGLSRTIWLPLNDLTKEILEQAEKLQPDQFLLPRIRHGWNIRDLVYRVSDNTLTAYFFRHNRLSKLANKGFDIYTLRYFKGAKTITSVEPYVQMAGTPVKKLAKHLD